MNVASEQVKAELRALCEEGRKLVEGFKQSSPDDNPLELKLDDPWQFKRKYQAWYTRAYKLLENLASYRVDEFSSYYLPDPKRIELTPDNYVIQDYLKDWSPDAQWYEHEWGILWRVQDYVCMQLDIVESILSSLDSILWDVERFLYSQLQDSEISAAQRLRKENPRAAGVIAGVVLEGHLQRVVSNRGITLKKARPTLSVLNDALYRAIAYDVATFRKIQYLGDIRNLCSHKSDREPTPEEVDDLISGVNMIVKNVL